MEKQTYDELVQLFQDGKISLCDFVLKSDDRDDYVEWCRFRDVRQDDDSARAFLAETEEKVMNGQISL